MNASLLSRIRAAIRPELETDTDTGTLDTDERASVLGLFEVLTADRTFPADRCLAHVDTQTSSRPGFLKAYRDGLALLDAAARKHFSGGCFRELEHQQRRRVLRKLLKRYPHPVNAPRWRRTLRVTGSHLDQMFTRDDTKRFRDFVVRDLLHFYYQGAEGWGTVGYDEFPGHVRHDREPCEVVKLIEDRGRLLLEMSDATIEELDPSGLLADEDLMLTVAVKSGRQRAAFSRSAYYAFVEYIDMDGSRFVLRLGEEEFEIPCE